jgi:hypothetical protein
MTTIRAGNTDEEVKRRATDEGKMRKPGTQE